jgi:hypothetical protein
VDKGLARASYEKAIWITWYILKSTSILSNEQLATIMKLYPHDNRPTQKLNHREVLEIVRLAAIIGRCAAVTCWVSDTINWAQQLGGYRI